MGDEVGGMRADIARLKNRVSSLEKQNEALRKAINLVGRKVAEMKEELPSTIDYQKPSHPTDPKSAGWFNDLLDGLKQK